MIGTLVVLALIVGGLAAYNGTTSATGNGGVRALTTANQADEADDNTDDGGSTNCPDNDTMQDAHGWQVGSDDPQPVFTGGAEWEPCQWVLQSTAIIELPLLKDWEYTVRLTNEDRNIAVYYGDGESTLDVYGATFRFLPAYNTDASDFANNECELLDFEHGYGMDRRTPYPTFNGNLDCESVPVGQSPDGDEIELPDLKGGNGGSDPKPTKEAGNNPTPTPGTSEFTGCESGDPEWYEDNIGGDDNNSKTSPWTAPDWPGGAWTASFEEQTVLTYPDFGVLRAGGTTENRTNGGTFSGDVSFHCDPATAGN
jgi:hypothetical protein